MNDVLKSLNTLQDIKQMMERSSRFISLSGLSGIAAGICALAGAAFAYNILYGFNLSGIGDATSVLNIQDEVFTESTLLITAVLTFIAAFISAFIFTYIRSRKSGIAIWGTTARRLMINVGIPMIVGGIYLLKLMEAGNYGLIAPGCLIFYGLALINAGKYTLPEIRYLGFAEIFTGLVNLWAIGYGIFFWAFGFGILHIFYGVIMWRRYERN